MNEPSKHTLRSLDEMRELVKHFRSKLHKLATTVDSNSSSQELHQEVVNFLSDYEANHKGYPLTNSDTLAIKKLEDYIIHKEKETETSKPSAEKYYIGPQKNLQGDTVSVLDATQISRGLESRNLTTREITKIQDTPSHKIEALKKAASPQLNYLPANPLETEVLDQSDSEKTENSKESPIKIQEKE